MALRIRFKAWSSISRPRPSRTSPPYFPVLLVRAMHTPSDSSCLRRFATSGFVELNPAEKVEEEGLPTQLIPDFYPVYIGEVFQSRYQVVSKLGFGMNSTVWLCRDLREHRYLTLKVCVRRREYGQDAQQIDHEVAVSKHLDGISIEHPGKKRIRRVLESFEIAGPNGNHRCLLYQPLGMSWTEFLKLLPENRLQKDLVQSSLQLLLIAVDYLHRCDVVHTDITTNNILQGIQDDSFFSLIEQGELEQPIPRKTLSDRTIYLSRPMPFTMGQPVLCDLGEARVGHQKHTGDIMPGIYRSPEVILGMEWDSKVDIWGIGVMTWDLLQGGHLFFAKKDGMLDDEQHLAEMVSLLGPPPLEFLKRSEKCRQFWDDEGNWKCSVPIPDQSFEIRERWLDAEDQALFLQFMRRTLCWIPEKRPTAEELVMDAFLMQHTSKNHGAA